MRKLPADNLLHTGIKQWISRTSVPNVISLLNQTSVENKKNISPSCLFLCSFDHTMFPVNWGDGEPRIHSEATSLDQQQPTMAHFGGTGPWRTAVQPPLCLFSWRRCLFWWLVHICLVSRVYVTKDSLNLTMATIQKLKESLLLLEIAKETVLLQSNQSFYFFMAIHIKS